jgi:hypothetical protein
MVTIILALATLGDATQIEMILIAKASKEDLIYLTFSPTNFANVQKPLQPKTNYTMDSWSQSYKTFYGRNLRIFLLS